MTNPVNPLPTQSRHPWRAVARTVLAAASALAALLPFLPDIVRASGLEQTAAGAAALAVAGAVTRILAVPGVNAWLRRYLSPLAADDK